MNNAEFVKEHGIVAKHVLAMLGNANSGVNRVKFITLATVVYILPFVHCRGGGLALADFRDDARSSNSLRGIVFPKTQKLLTKLPGLATSGHHNSAMITNAENSRPNGPSMEFIVSIFTIRITLKYFPWDARCAPEMDFPNFRQCPLSDIVQ